MRHRNKAKRIGRKPNQGRLILKNLATSVLLYERVRTTKKRAQVVRPLVERIITLAKRTERQDRAIRLIRPLVADDNACRKVLEVLRGRYAKRTSGFTRIVPLGMRQGDGALLCELSLVDAVVPSVATETDAAVATEKAPKAAPKKRAPRTAANKKDPATPSA